MRVSGFFNRGKGKSDFPVRLLLGLAALPILSVVVVLIIINTTVRGVIYDGVIDVTQRDLIIFANEIDSWFESAGNSVEHLIMIWENVGVEPGDEHSIDPIATSFVDGHDYFPEVNIGFESGRFIGGSGWLPPPEWDVTVRPWVLEAAANPGEIVTILPYLSAIEDHGIVAAKAKWVPDINGMWAVVGVDIKLGYIMEMLAEFSVPADGYLILLSPDGEIIFHPNTEYIPRHDGLTNIREIPNGEFMMDVIAIRAESGRFEDARMGESYFMVFPVSTAGWYLAAVVPVAATELPVFNNTVVIMIPVLILSIFISVGTVLFVMRIMKQVEKKRAENETKERIAALEREANELNEIFIKHSPIVMNIWDEKINLVSTSLQSTTMFGLESMEQYIEQFDNLSPEYQPDGLLSREKAGECVKQAFRDGSNRFDWMHQKLNGEPVPAEIIMERFTRDGKPYVAVFTIDLRQARALQQIEAAQAANNRMQAMLNVSPLACFILDENLNVIDLNHATLSLFGAESKQFFIDNFFDVVPEHQPDGELSVEIMRRLMASIEEIIHFEWIAQTMQGETFPGEVHVARFFIDGEKAAIVYIRDLRDFYKLKEMSERLEEAIGKEQSANRAKSDFLAKMSHEIRTPMNAILGMAELVLREKISERAAEHTMTIKNSGNHLLSIINDILDLSKIESGKMELVNSNYFLHSTVNDIVNIINARMTNPKVKFAAYMEQDVPNHVWGDEVRFRQILLNLLNNAVKFTKEGNITLEVSWKSQENDIGVFTMRVKDTGIGIEAENIDNLFGEFSQFDLEKNRYTEGTGLGLAITYNLVKLMDGEIHAESAYGTGSTFTVILPLKYEESGTSEILESAEIAPDGKSVLLSGRTRIDAGISRKYAVCFTAPTAKILVVDDMVSNLAVAEGLLESYGIAATLCETGDEALQALKEAEYDLVFMDHMMPGMDGLETVSVIRGLGKYAELPIIALSANALTGAREMFLQNGFNDFISKPIEVDKLDALLTKWLPAEKQQPTSPDEETAKEPPPPLNVDLFIPGVNVSRGVANSGTFERYLYLLKVFRKDGEVKLKQLAKCLEENDISLYTTNVHALKSGCTNIGVEKIAAQAEELETAGARHDLGFIAKHNPSFVEVTEALLAALDAAINAITAKQRIDNENLDYDAMKPLLLELRNALKKFDVAAIDKASEALQDFSRYEAVGKAISEILQSAFTSKFKQALTQIDELLIAIKIPKGE